MASTQKPNKTNLPINFMGNEFNPLLTLQHDLSKTMSHFYDLFEPKHFNMDHFENIKLSPCMDLVETKDHFKIEVEMPGLDEKNIKVSICDNMLSICGEKSLSKKDLSKNYIDREIRYGRYERSISLPQTADWEHVSATFKKGMLWITIPKKASKKSSSRDVKICRMDAKK
ncbi:MAG: Hsp20/alpha crystallin family protein [Legionellaceae bacterium]|nr:Hsp20/alpha crystallin family protein [Legionellaceae bacterium]